MNKLQRMIITGALMAAIPVAGASAVTKTVATPVATPTPSPSSSPGETDAQRITNLKTRGAAEIQRRITNLNTSLTALTGSAKLTSADKAALSSQVQSELTGLNALKAKLAADTTLTDCQTDVQSIFSDYRVYALLLPKVRMISAADSFTTVEAELVALQPELQTAVDTQKADGKNTTSLQASLDDMQTKTGAASALTSGLVTDLLVLQPSDYNANHTVLETYRTSLGTALTDLQAARSDAKLVVAGVL